MLPLYDSASVIQETAQAGAMVASYTTDPTMLVGQIISRRDSSGQATYYSYDGTGAVRNLTDQTQTQVASYTYDAFGNALSQSGTGANNYEFSTKEQDQTGLYYFGARYYDPEIGRFVTKDPSFNNLRDPRALHLEDPQTLNPYTYCENDPVNFFDFLGRERVPLDPFLGRQELWDKPAADRPTPSGGQECAFRRPSGPGYDPRVYYIGQLELGAGYYLGGAFLVYSGVQ